LDAGSMEAREGIHWRIVSRDSLHARRVSIPRPLFRLALQTRRRRESDPTPHGRNAK
jgi:hypothetical protein